MTVSSIESKRASALKELAILDTPREERFERLTRIAARIFNVPVAQITLLDGDRQWFKSIQGSELTEVPRAMTFCTHTVESEGGTMVVNDATKDQRFDGNPLVHSAPNVRFYAGVSLYYYNNVPLGTLCILDIKPRKMSDADMAILEDIAAIAQREMVSIQLAMLDELTGLSNRRGFISNAENFMLLAQREDKKVSLAFIDLDDFKIINDNFGHKKGDEALKEFSEELQSACRASDLVARIGGDEFAVLFMGADKQAAANKLARLSDTLTEKNKHSAHQLLFSFGVVECDLSAEFDIVELLDEGDQLMYADKNQRSRA